MKSILTKYQRKTFTKTDKDGQECICTIRYDDSCGNGHNSFSITTQNGCDHETVAELFPELEKYIKWHLMTSECPMHYISNTLYHASEINKHDNFVYLHDTGFNFTSLIGMYSDCDVELIKRKYKDIKELRIEIEVRQSEMNKKPNLDAARRSSIWPDAEFEDLTEKNLKARLPKLIAEFKKDIEELGFIF